jgi:hypothetical protein
VVVGFAEWRKCIAIVQVDDAVDSLRPRQFEASVDDVDGPIVEASAVEPMTVPDLERLRGSLLKATMLTARRRTQSVEGTRPWTISTP